MCGRSWRIQSNSLRSHLKQSARTYAGTRAGRRKAAHHGGGGHGGGGPRRKGRKASGKGCGEWRAMQKQWRQEAARRAQACAKFKKTNLAGNVLVSGNVFDCLQDRARHQLRSSWSASGCQPQREQRKMRSTPKFRCEHQQPLEIMN